MTNNTICDTIRQSPFERGTCLNPRKIIEKMKRQPNGIRYDEAKKVLEYYGFSFIRQKSSHAHFLSSETGELITIKVDNPLKKVYIVDILQRIGE